MWSIQDSQALPFVELGSAFPMLSCIEERSFLHKERSAPCDHVHGDHLVLSPQQTAGNTKPNSKARQAYLTLE